MTAPLDDLIDMFRDGLEELTRRTLRESGCILYHGPASPDEKEAAQEYASQWPQDDERLVAQQGFIAGCDWMRMRFDTHSDETHQPCWCSELQALGCDFKVAQLTCEVMRREHFESDARARQAEGALVLERQGAQRQEERTDAVLYHRLAKALRHLMVHQNLSLHLRDGELTDRRQNDTWTRRHFAAQSDTWGAFKTVEEILTTNEDQRRRSLGPGVGPPWQENEHFLTWYAHKMGWNSKDVRRLIRRAPDRYAEYLEVRAEIRGDDP